MTDHDDNEKKAVEAFAKVWWQMDAPVISDGNYRLIADGLRAASSLSAPPAPARDEEIERLKEELDELRATCFEVVSTTDIDKDGNHIERPVPKHEIERSRAEAAESQLAALQSERAGSGDAVRVKAIDRQKAADAAVKANHAYGQWMPEQWLHLFLDAYEGKR